MKVSNYKDFQKLDYKDLGSNNEVKNGDILIKDNEIGVVIQEYGNEEFRVDMWGNSCIEEVDFATEEQIKKYRPELYEN